MGTDEIVYFCLVLTLTLESKKKQTNNTVYLYLLSGSVFWCKYIIWFWHFQPVWSIMYGKRMIPDYSSLHCLFFNSCVYLPVIIVCLLLFFFLNSFLTIYLRSWQKMFMMKWTGEKTMLVSDATASYSCSLWLSSKSLLVNH